MENLVWKSSDAAIVFSVGTAVVCFSLYWFAAHSKRFKTLVDVRMGAGHFHEYGAFYQKAMGVVLLAGIPALVALFFLPKSLTGYGLGFTSLLVSVYWVLGLGGVLFFVPRFSARKKEMQSYYPQVRVPVWSRNLLILNGIVWVIYLFAYEFLFRGFILLNIAGELGWWPAIVISTAICTVTHFPKGGSETVGTIPLSVLLCLIVVQTGSIWVCVITHSILAISNDYWALSYHPQMSLETIKSFSKSSSP